MTLKISKTIGIITRLRHFLPTSVLLSICSFLIHPYLSYGLAGKGQTSKRNLVRILILQKRATRLIYFSDNFKHPFPPFLRTNILPIDMLCYKSVGALMHDINHDFVPINLKNLFSKIASIHSYDNRAAATGKFYVIHSRTKQLNQSFSSLGARIWNKIREFLQSQLKQSFKKHLQTELLQFLVHHEGVYVIVYNLAVKLFLNLIYIVIYKFVLHYKLRLFVFFSMH